MVPAAKAFMAAKSVLEDAFAHAETVVVRWQRNSGLILDNWRMLHAREASDGSDAGVRVLERVLIAETPA
jgi:alpha-ketoglutarate-dependent taurine dioxygenase